jgi:hypothetical protein
MRREVDGHENTIQRIEQGAGPRKVAKKLNWPWARENNSIL